ncbi:MAG: hypothetical protein GY835_03160 [bacterium]|nr:hypothetical protein [bacterium]
MALGQFKWQQNNAAGLGAPLPSDRQRVQLPPARTLRSNSLLQRMAPVVSSCSNTSFVAVATSKKASLFTFDGVFIRHLESRPRGTVLSAALTMAGSLAAVGYSSRWVDLLDLKSMGVTRSLRTRSRPRLLHFLPDGTLAVAGKKRIEHYDVKRAVRLADADIVQAELLAASPRHELYYLSKKRALASLSLETLRPNRRVKLKGTFDSLTLSWDGSVLMGTRRVGLGAEAEWRDGAYLRYFGRADLQEAKYLSCAVRPRRFLVCHGRRAVILNPARPEKVEEHYDLPFAPVYLAAVGTDGFLAQDEENDVWIVTLPAVSELTKERGELNGLGDMVELPPEMTRWSWKQLKLKLGRLLATVEERYQMRMALALSASDYRRLRTDYDEELLGALIRFRGALRDAGILDAALDQKLSETYETVRADFLAAVESRLGAKQIIP